MPKVNVAEFLTLAQHHPIIDVRSPGEYAHAHIPGAISLPLFTDEERKVVGTAYKQQSREDAIKIGLDYYGPKMRKIVEEVEQLLHSRQHKGGPEEKWVLLHCWRGGMRSAAVAWLLELYGFKVFLLIGGYKAYRNWVLAQFEKPYSFKVLGGYTGSGKTEALHQLRSTGKVIIDLEGIARHKGSAFGGFGQMQPSQEMFENELAGKLLAAQAALPDGSKIWVEDESQRIGGINLPNALWHTIRQARVYFLDIPFDARLDFITRNYGKHKMEELVNAVIRIQKRLGNESTKNAINLLLEGRHRDAFAILLRYYDKYYKSSLQKRENVEQLTTVIPAEVVDAEVNRWLLISLN